ncbi:unnamed protein product [Toxocara canis]|uniref:Rab_eff_C domain-containing protein n=1 Tax=Toxocara canis TaxID=6265 RepID=A0A183TZ71_TOXCA|nr:unnamed protein product [Toxocara canis]
MHTATANGELRGNVKRDAIKRPSNSEDVLVVKRSKNNERNKLLTAHEDYGPVGTQPVLSNKMVVGAGTLCARTSFLEDVDARTQTKTQPRVLANDTCATQSSANGQIDAKERAATGSRVLAEDSSDEEASHKKRTVIDDEVRTTVAESVMDGDDSGGELIHRDLYDLEKRINRNHRRRLKSASDFWNTLDNENLSEITENTVLDDSIIAGPANQSRIADLETQFLLNPVLHSTQRSAHHMNLAQRRTSTAVSAGNSTTSRTAKITSSRTFKGAVEGSTVASAREKRQVLKQRERSPKGGEQKSLKEEWESQKEGAQLRSAFEADNTARANGTCEKDDSAAMLDTEMEQEEQDDNLILGLDLETIRRKLAKVVEYCDLEKHKPGYSHVSNENVTSSVGVSNISARSALATPNFKRFVKVNELLLSLNE